MVTRSPRSAWARIKELLIEAGYAGIQKDVETLIGAKQGSVSEWNTTTGSPSLQNAIALGLKLNACVEWILTERGPKRPGPPMEPAAQDLWDLWGRIPEDERRELVGYARALARPSRAAKRP